MDTFTLIIEDTGPHGPRPVECTIQSRRTKRGERLILTSVTNAITNQPIPTSQQPSLRVLLRAAKLYNWHHANH